MDNNYSPDVEGFPTTWIRVESASGGYSLEIPDDWSATFGTRGTANIRPPASNYGGVYVRFLQSEKPIEADLTPWLRKWYEAEFVDNPYLGSLTFEEVAFESAGIGVSEVSYEHHVRSPRGQAYILASGPLVLHIGTSRMNDRQDAILRRMAESIEFASDAPKSLEELNDPNHQTMETTYSVSPNYYLNEHDAWRAFQARIATGKPPDRHLDDPGFVAKYTQYMRDNAAWVARVDCNRVADPRLLLDAPDDLLLHTMACLSLDGNAVSNWYPPSQPASPLNTPAGTTAGPTSVPDGGAEESWYSSIELTPFIGECMDKSGCWNVTWYESEKYEAREYGEYDSYWHLDHLQIDDCSLSYMRGGSEASAFSAQVLEGAEWVVFYFGRSDYLYTPIQAGLPFGIFMHLPADQEYREEEKMSCQKEIEAVIGTASVIYATMQ